MIDYKKLFELTSPDNGAVREHNANEYSLGFGEFHSAIIRNFKPERLLCIGSRYGYIPAIMALACKEIGTGFVDFVDANYNDSIHGKEVAYGGIGYWDNPMNTFIQLGVEDYIRPYIMRTDEFFPTCTHQYEYVYFDGNHSYDGVNYDVSESIKRTKMGAWFIFHDVKVKTPDFGVSKVFFELNKKRFQNLMVPIYPGLGIARRIA